MISIPRVRYGQILCPASRLRRSRTVIRAPLSVPHASILGIACAIKLRLIIYEFAYESIIHHFKSSTAKQHHSRTRHPASSLVKFTVSRQRMRIPVVDGITVISWKLTSEVRPIRFFKQGRGQPAASSSYIRIAHDFAEMADPINTPRSSKNNTKLIRIQRSSK
jgi:hypothetical protein